MKDLFDEILTEVFLRCVDKDVVAPYAVGFHQSNAWVLAQVCRQWRDVALSSPRLWCRIVLPQSLSQTESLPRLERALKIQLDRAMSAPLSIRLQGAHALDFLDQLLAASIRWEEITLVEPEGMLLSKALGKKDTTFPGLDKLKIISVVAEGVSDLDLRRSMPSLKHLIWNVKYPYFPQQVPLVAWPQLRTCVLRGIHLTDILRILPLLSAEAHVSLAQVVYDVAFSDEDDVASSEEAAPDAPSTISNIASLTIDSVTLQDGVLHHFLAPALQKLVISDPNDGSAEPGLDSQQVNDFLDNSGSSLKHLRVQSSILGPYIDSAQLLEIVQSPRGQDLVQLDVFCISHTLHFLRTLANKDEWVPNLRTLVLVGVEEADVMKILFTRNPIIRVIDLHQWEWDFPKKVVEDGLDVVILRRLNVEVPNVNLPQRQPEQRCPQGPGGPFRYRSQVQAERERLRDEVRSRRKNNRSTDTFMIGIGPL